MILTDLRNSLRKRIGSPSTTDVPDSPNLDQHINDAYQEIFNKYKFRKRRGRAKFTTVAGQDKYDVTSLTNVIYKVWDRTNGLELEYVGSNVLSERDYDASPNALVQNGRPQQWAFFETYLQLLPPPDGTYSIELVYKNLFNALVLPGDSPSIPADWHRGIVILASHHYFDDEAGDLVKALYHDTAFDKWVSSQPVEEHERTEAIDSGVEIPPLNRGGIFSSMRKPDGIFWEILP